MPDFITNWDKTLEILREELNDTMFDTWIAPLVPKKMDNMSGTLYVEGENEYKIQRFNERYLQIANSAASIAFGHPVHIEASVAAAPPAVEVLPEDIEKLGPSADYSDYPDDLDFLVRWYRSRQTTGKSLIDVHRSRHQEEDEQQEGDICHRTCINLRDFLCHYFMRLV